MLQPYLQIHLSAYPPSTLKRTSDPLLRVLEHTDRGTVVSGKSFAGYEGVITGWGARKQGGSSSQILHEVYVPIMSNDDCKKTEYDEKRITANMLCAGYPEGKKDSCQVIMTAATTLNTVWTTAARLGFFFFF